MKKELKKFTTDLLLANNLEKISKSKKDIINFFDKIDEKVLSATIKPIIEDEYQKMIEMLRNDFDANIEQERLKIVCFLTSLNMLLNY